MNGAELRVLLSLLLKLGMAAADAVELFRQHGVTDEQIREGDLENEINVYEAAQKLREERES